jgi:hypothetical protein
VISSLRLTMILPRRRILDVIGGRAAERALGQRGHHVAAVKDGRDRDATGRAAIVLRDDAVLRDVDETTREIARVRRLQRRCRPGPCGRRASS